jgi:cytochrome c oxidase subunit II
VTESRGALSVGRPHRGSHIPRWALPLLLLPVLSACADDTAAGRLAMPDPAAAEGQPVLDLWQGAWIAALATGVVVWGLILFVVVRYRRRSDDEVPVQTRYNLPLEIFYTLAPVVMVVVFFDHTVRVQNDVIDANDNPDNIIEVVGQQWSWTFNHGIGEMDESADDDRFDDEFAYDQYAYEVGTGSYIPDLWLPVGVTTRFNLHSPDVIHDLGVPNFLRKMDVIPGRVNQYAVTPTREGEFLGKCYELCGTSHSRMLFNVKVVSQAEYDAYVDGLVAKGDTSETPLLGGEDTRVQDGLEDEEAGEEE